MILQLVAALAIAGSGVFLGLAIGSGSASEDTGRVLSGPVRVVDTGAVENSPEPVLTTTPSTNSDAAPEPAITAAQTVVPSVVLISQIDSDTRTTISQGSGIVWDEVDGYIVTNEHVVSDITGGVIPRVTVKFADGAEVEGEVIGGSVSQDVAVVRVDPADVDRAGSELRAAEFADASSVEVGQLAVAVGSPFGLTSTVTAGIVSGVRFFYVPRESSSGGINTATQVPVEMIQTDAPINQGNSGGALADRHGRVIGMNSLIQTAGGGNGNLGIGFAVPSQTVELIAGRIVNGESLELGFFGISREACLDEESVTASVGVIVCAVVEGSPAQAAGIEAGDVIVAFDGKPIADFDQFAAEVTLHQPGSEVEVTFLRDGDRWVVTVVLALRAG